MAAISQTTHHYHEYKIALVALAVFTLTVATLSAQDYTVLHSFNGVPDGAYPRVGVVAGGNTFYGTTIGLGIQNGGTIWKVNQDGTGYAVLKNFDSSGGINPNASLVTDGNVGSYSVEVPQ